MQSRSTAEVMRFEDIDPEAQKRHSGDPEIIENTIQDYISRGYLTQDQNSEGCTWRWT